MFGVDKGADAALFLFLGHHMQGQRRLAAGFRPVDLDDPALGQAADPQRDVQTQRSGRGRLDVHRRAVGAKAHDRALAELPFDLCQRRFQRLRLVHIPLPTKVEEVCHRHVALLISQPPGGGNPACVPQVFPSLWDQKGNISTNFSALAAFARFG